MTTIPITSADADRDLERCATIAHLCRVLDNTAALIEACAATLDGCASPEALIPVRAAAAQARTIAGAARDTIA